MTAPLVAKTPYDVDVVAAEIARVALVARHMPPAWDGAKVAHGFTGTQGENLGRVLPGRGVALCSDLKSLGITKPIPYVYEKTLAMKAIDACGGRERLALTAAAVLASMKLGALGMTEALHTLPLFVGAINNYDGILNGRANGKAEDVNIFCGSITTLAATNWASLIRASTRFPAGTFSPPAIPGGVAPNRTTTGALSIGLTTPTGGDLKYLLTIGYTSGSTLNMLMLVDMLSASSGINANINTEQTVSTAALTRYRDGASAGNLMTLEVTTGLSTVASNLTVTYTNSAGANTRSTGAQAMTTSAGVGRLQPTAFGPYTPLQSGDIGVQSVQSLIFSQPMGAGVLNLYIYRPLHFLPGIATNIYVERDSTVQIDGLTELVVGNDGHIGCLNFFVMTNGTSSGNFNAFLRTVAG